jgi:hypothetical protein
MLKMTRWNQLVGTHHLTAVVLLLLRWAMLRLPPYLLGGNSSKQSEPLINLLYEWMNELNNLRGKNLLKSPNHREEMDELSLRDDIGAIEWSGLLLVCTPHLCIRYIIVSVKNMLHVRDNKSTMHGSFFLCKLVVLGQPCWVCSTCLGLRNWLKLLST